jgi:hypothetical protein
MGRFTRLLYLGVAAATLYGSALPASGQSGTASIVAPRFKAVWRHAIFIQPVLLSRYNRVDGIVQSLNLHGRLPYDYSRVPLLETYGRLDVRTTALPHYSIRGGSAGATLNLAARRLGVQHGLWTNIGAEYHKGTVSPDDWIVGDAENTLSALLLKYDYKNYYLHEGYHVRLSSVFVPCSQTMRFGLQLAWHDDLHWPLIRATDWSLVPLQRSFRPNITAVHGRERALRLEADFTIQDTPRAPHRLFSLHVNLEDAGGSLGGDFDYDGACVEAHLATVTFARQWLTVRLLGGARTGTLAPQHLLRVGGIGTLRGVPHQRYTGNRMWLVNAEYRLGTIMPSMPPFLIFKSDIMRRAIALTDIGVFYDVGSAYHSGSGAVLDDWFAGNAIDNWGVFVSIAEDLIRFEWATMRGVGHEHDDIFRMRVGLRR